MEKSAPSRSQGYLLATFPDCDVLYAGPNYGTSLLIVGRNTPDEALFDRKSMAAAEAHAVLTKGLVENLPVTGLCYDAVVAVLGA